jgi:hypothetical protein
MVLAYLDTGKRHSQVQRLRPLDENDLFFADPLRLFFLPSHNKTWKTC